MTKKDQKIQTEMTGKEVIAVPAHVDQVMCDGGGGPLGHPQVWYTFDGRTEAHCFYCGRVFVKQPKTATSQ